MKRLSIAILVTNFAFCLPVYAKQDTTSLELKCSEESVGDDESYLEGDTLTTVAVQFSADGKVQKLEFVRKAADGFDAVNKTFDRANSTFEHTMLKEPLDAEGNPMNNFGIYEIENLVVLQNGKEALRLRINDHSYAGTPGSSFAYPTQDKGVIDSWELQHVFSCDGRVMDPRNSALDGIEL